jgi:tetratricopeptide (TPR) repeat protein
LAEDRPLFVAREEDVAVLSQAWAEARAGKPQFVRLQAPFGGGRRAAAGEFLRTIANTPEDPILWRVTCLDQENGLQWLVRMYGSLVATLTADAMRRGKIELLLTTGLPAQPKRVQGWYQEFISSLKEAKTDREKGAVQLKIPRDNPLLGLVEITVAIARKVPVVIELQSPYACYSVALTQFIEALVWEGNENQAKLLVILHDEPDDDVSKALHPMPLLDLYQRKAEFIKVHAIPPWGESETKRFLDSKGVTADAARIAAIAGGRPGYIAELVDILTERNMLNGDLSSVTLASLVPMAVDATAIEVPDEPPAEGQRKHATADDLGRAAHFAALLGQAFPSNLVADMGGWERDSIDDLVDAAEDLFEEVQFAEEMNAWIYKFKRGSWREGILERNNTPEGHELARRVGFFMERFLVPRGYAFIARTARVYAEHQAGQRAHVLRSLALSNDTPDIWGLSYDLLKYFDEVKWPDVLRRTVLMNLLDRLVASGTVQAAEQVHNDASEWASKNEDREFTAWLLFAGSRLDARRQDFYRARDRARDALKLYEGLNNDMRRAEIWNHIAGVELQDGNTAAAAEAVDQAVELGKVDGPDGAKAVVPGIFANAEFIRGVLARRVNNVQQAAEHFRRANEVAGQTGMGALALDAGLSFGEALLVGGQTDKARDVLDRVVQIAKQLRNPVRERNASELLAQAEGQLRNFPAALQHANRTWELSKALKLDQALPVDLYNLGFFHYALQKPTEALAFFRQAAAYIGPSTQHPVVKELWFFMGLSYLQTGNLDDAKTSLRNGLRPAQAVKDWRRMVSALENLATIEEKQGNGETAKKLLADAIGFAEKGDLKEERRTLRRRLDGIA